MIVASRILKRVCRLVRWRRCCKRLEAWLKLSGSLVWSALVSSAPEPHAGEASCACSEQHSAGNGAEAETSCSNSSNTVYHQDRATATCKAVAEGDLLLPSATKLLATEFSTLNLSAGSDAQAPRVDSSPLEVSRTAADLSVGHQVQQSARIHAASNLCKPAVQQAVCTVIALANGDNDLDELLLSSPSIKASVQLFGEHVYDFKRFSPKVLHQLIGLPDMKSNYRTAEQLIAASHFFLPPSAAAQDALSLGVNMLGLLRSSAQGKDVKTPSSSGLAGSTADDFEPRQHLTAEEAFDALSRIPARPRMHIRNMLGGDTPRRTWIIKGLPLLRCLHALVYMPPQFDAVVLQLLRSSSDNEKYPQLTTAGLNLLRRYAVEYIGNLNMYPAPDTACVTCPA